MNASDRTWNTLQAAPSGRIAGLLHNVLACGERVCLEGNNRKQAAISVRTIMASM
jgi:hypothetical protein